MAGVAGEPRAKELLRSYPNSFNPLRSSPAGWGRGPGETLNYSDSGSLSLTFSRPGPSPGPLVGALRPRTPVASCL